MNDEQRRRTPSVIDEESSDIIKKIEELAARCDALEASNIFLAAQLTEVNRAWRDAITAIAAPDPEMARSWGGILREIAAQSSGLRQQIFLEMTGIVENAMDQE